MNTDVETARDVSVAILDGVGFWIGAEVDNALFSGCNLISVAEVKANDDLNSLTFYQDKAILG